VRSRAIGKLKGGTFLIAVMDMANHNSSSTHVIKYHKPKVLTGQVGAGRGPAHGVAHNWCATAWHGRG
jgi:acetate kinase